MLSERLNVFDDYPAAAFAIIGVAVAAAAFFFYLDYPIAVRVHSLSATAFQKITNMSQGGCAHYRGWSAVYEMAGGDSKRLVRPRIYSRGIRQGKLLSALIATWNAANSRHTAW